MSQQKKKKKISRFGEETVKISKTETNRRHRGSIDFVFLRIREGKNLYTELS